MTSFESTPTRSPAATATAAGGELRVERGTCFALFAYDIGLSIDLDEAQRRITDMKQRESIRHKRRAPRYFQYQPAPLRITQSAAPVTIGAHTTASTIDLVLYDFGAVSVTYTIPLSGPVSELLTLSGALYDHPRLLEESRRSVDALLRTIEPAVAKPSVADVVEDYCVYQIDALAAAPEPDRTITDHAALFARILRAEASALSRQEIDDALACQLSFGAEDRAIIDWNAALLFDRDADDVRAVLEFANVELLEMRFLDDRLDAALDRAYQAVSRCAARFSLALDTTAADLRRIAQLQMDAALLFEGVNNALKLLGDQYLARVYRVTSQRFHLNDWDASILRKLNTVESIYQKMSDRHANRRLELLEWIIIVLIGLEILLTLVLSRTPR